MKKVAFLAGLLIFLIIFVPACFIFFKMSIRPGATPVVEVCDRHSVPCERFNFQSQDGVRIEGAMIGPQPFDKRHFAFIASGFGLNMSDDLATLRIQELVKRGFTVAIIDPRNHGKSQKSPSLAGAMGRIDVKSSFHYLLQTYGFHPSLAWCGSMGCNSSVYGLLDYQKEHAESSLAHLILEVPMEGPHQSIASYIRVNYHLPWFPIGWIAMKLGEVYTGTSAKNLDIKQDISALRVDHCVVLHAEHDQYFSVENSQKIAQNAQPPCQLIVALQARHTDAFESLVDRSVLF